MRYRCDIVRDQIVDKAFLRDPARCCLPSCNLDGNSLRVCGIHGVLQVVQMFMWDASDFAGLFGVSWILLVTLAAGCADSKRLGNTSILAAVMQTYATFLPFFLLGCAKINPQDPYARW